MARQKVADLISKTSFWTLVEIFAGRNAGSSRVVFGFLPLCWEALHLPKCRNAWPRLSRVVSCPRSSQEQLFIGICPSRCCLTLSRSIQSSWANSVMGLQVCRCRSVRESFCGASEEGFALLPGGTLSNCGIELSAVYTFGNGRRDASRGLVSVGVMRLCSEIWGFLRLELGVGLQRNGRLAFATIIVAVMYLLICYSIKAMLPALPFT